MTLRISSFPAVRHSVCVTLVTALLAVAPLASSSAQAQSDLCQAVSEARTDHAVARDPAMYGACVAVAEEAAGWPDFDPSSLGDHVRQVERAKAEAAEEAAGWPDFDPSGLAAEVARVEQAKTEAAGWPDFDPSNVVLE